MDLSFQRRVDRIVGGWICRLLSLFSRFGRRAPPGPFRPRRILVILLSEMGSLVLAQPMFRWLRDSYPDAHLHALVFERNREVLDLMAVMPGDNVLTISDRSFGSLAGDSLRTIRAMRRLDVDAVVDCELFARIGSIFSWFSGAAVRAGFHPHTQEGLYRGSFINRPVVYNPYVHISEQFITLAMALESASVPKARRPLSGGCLEVSPTRLDGREIAALGNRLLDDFPQLGSKTLVLVYPGGGVLPIRAWPEDRYVALCRLLLQAGYSVALIGLPSDRPLARHIVTRCGSGQCIDLTGYTKCVRDLLVLFHLSPLLVTNDGGPGQFAALTPISTIILFGPETPVLYGPLSARAHFFFQGISCSPCLTAYNHRESPCDGDNQCLKSIGHDVVFRKAAEILEGHGRMPLSECGAMRR